MCKVLTGATASAVQAASVAAIRAASTWNSNQYNCVTHNSCHFINDLLSTVTSGAQSMTTYFPDHENAMLQPVC